VVGVATEVDGLEGLPLEVLPIEVDIVVLDKEDELAIKVVVEWPIIGELDEGVCDQIVFVPETNGNVTETDVGLE